MCITNLSVRINRLKTIQILLMPFVFSAMVFAGQQNGELPQGIINALKAGDTEVLSQYFNTSLELAMPSAQDDIYSKQQAKLIIRDFFTKHVPTDFKILHKGGPDGSQYAIGSLTTKSGTFRVTLLVKEKDNELYIHQLRLEKENAD